MRRVLFTLLLLVFGAKAQAENKSDLFEKEQLLKQIHKLDFDYKSYKSKFDKVNIEIISKTKYYTLEDCITTAIQNNPIIQAALLDIRSQEKALLSARLSWAPQFGFNSDPAIGRYWDRTIYTPLSPGTDKYPQYTVNEFSNNTISSMNTSLSWFFLDIPRDKQIAEQMDVLKQYKSLYNVAVRDLIQQVQINYASLQSSLVALQKYEDIISASSKAVNALDKQYQYKFVSLADISTARTQQFNLISNYLEVYASITGYSSSLAGLLGIDKDTLILPSENIAKPNDWPISLNESILMSKNNNDQYKSLLAQAQSLQSKAEGLKLSYLPRLYMGVYGTFQYNRGYIDANEQPSLRQLNNNSATYWTSTAGIGLTMNFDGGQSIAAGQQAEYAGKSVQQQALGSQIDYVTRVKSAYQDLQTNKLRVEASEQAVKQSENVALVLKTIATMGIADTVQQVQSIDLYGNAVIGYATALRQAKIAEINLYRYTSTLPEQIERLSVVGLHN